MTNCKRTKKIASKVKNNHMKWDACDVIKGTDTLGSVKPRVAVADTIWLQSWAWIIRSVDFSVYNVGQEQRQTGMFQVVATPLHHHPPHPHPSKKTNKKNRKSWRSCDDETVKSSEMFDTQYDTQRSPSGDAAMWAFCFKVSQNNTIVCEKG